MYYCIECGHIFDKNDVAIWNESRGEYWGVLCSESVSGCPCCGGGYVETYMCSCCNEWISGNYIKLEGGERICEHCFTVYKLGDED